MARLVRNGFAICPEPARANVKSECAFCHIASAKRDEVWTQFYPMLDEVALPPGNKKG
jgi:hypothetical protein